MALSQKYKLKICIWCKKICGAILIFCCFRETFCKILMRISQRTYYRTQAVIASGITNLVRKSRTISKGEKGMAAVGFMAYIVNTMGDKSPETNRILLPSGLTTAELYKRYLLQYLNEAERIKQKRFYQLWAKHFSNVSVLKRHSNFSTCNVCLMATEILEANHPPEVHEACRRDWDEHLIRQQQERLAYYRRRNESQENPSNVLSLIQDGMDQAKTNIPHFASWQLPKQCDSSKLLRTHITGIMLHGLGTYMMIDIMQYPHDSNLTLNCLLQILSIQAKDGILPKKMYIQLDNCARENKNKYFLAMMSVLVVKGIVDEVLLSFLMVGHTHEDIDARLSKISAALRLKTAKTLDELKRVVETSIVLGMKVCYIPKVFDIKSWLTPYLKEVHNHGSPHVYRIYRDLLGNAVIKYKQWSTDETWLPGSLDEQLHIFQQSNDGKPLIPHGIPKEVVPDMDRKNCLNDIQQNIFHHHMKAFLNWEQANWWEKFFSSPGTVAGYKPETPWYLCELKGTLEMTEKPRDTVSTLSPLVIFMEKERSSKKVYTGKRKNIDKENRNKKFKSDATEEFMIVYLNKSGSPNIGKVTHIQDEDVLTVIKYQGTLDGTWLPAMIGKGMEYKEEIDKNKLVDGMIFQLTTKQSLPLKVKKVFQHYFESKNF